MWEKYNEEINTLWAKHNTGFAYITEYPGVATLLVTNPPICQVFSTVDDAKLFLARRKIAGAFDLVWEGARLVDWTGPSDMRGMEEADTNV